MEFQRLVELAKSDDERGWQERFMRYQARFDCVSICGWIYPHDVSMISRDASKCRVMDTRFLKTLRGLGYTDEQLRWIDIGSYIGCPVAGTDGRPAGVLLVTKNLRNGLNPEDLEVLILV
jgi:rubredoxin